MSILKVYHLNFIVWIKFIQELCQNRGGFHRYICVGVQTSMQQSEGKKNNELKEEEVNRGKVGILIIILGVEKDVLV